MADKHLFEVDLAQYETSLKKAKRDLEIGRWMLDKATDAAKESALAAIAAGMPERQVHLKLGVSIPTLRKWQGKK